MKYLYRCGACLALLWFAMTIWATETENIGLLVLPASGPIVIDGKATDWNLSAGIFSCGDVEQQRDKFACWFFASYDTNDLYLLTNWIDPTPLNNIGSSKGDYGWAGDCLQLRVITSPGTPQERTSHWTCWRDRDGISIMDVQYGKGFDEEHIKNALTAGTRQAFRVNADRSGYAQEIAIPWSLLVKAGAPTPRAGEQMQLTIEPNFTSNNNGRISVKDIFKAGIVPDRVFTFASSRCWGDAKLLPPGVKTTQRSVRLADGREFAVTLKQGMPVVDWSGLYQSKELKGFKAINFTMPKDGYISLNIYNADGQVVRQLLNNNFFTRGKHQVWWDGLTTMNWRTPGQTVSAGRYSWKAIWHQDIHLSLLGWADNSGSAPWDSSPTTNWGGDHGLPACCASAGEMVYLGWSAAEAGKALLACNLRGDIKWKNSRYGMSGASLVAVDNGIVYVETYPNELYRLEAKTGTFSLWEGTDSPDLIINKAISDVPNLPELADAMDARQGKLYLAFTAINLVAVLDGRTGQLLKKITIVKPNNLKCVTDDLLYVLSDKTTLLAMNTETGETTPVLTGLLNAQAVAVDSSRKIYLGVNTPDNQVKVYSQTGEFLSSIGRKGGRSLLGKWTPDGMAFINNLALDATGKLWVAEEDEFPKRFSVWDTVTGRMLQEFFGPTEYGALGGAINPRDPRLMVGQGCEWRLNPDTGRATCLGVITRDGMKNARFATGANGRLYLVSASSWGAGYPVRIFERLGDADFRLRAKFSYSDGNTTYETYTNDGHIDRTFSTNSTLTFSAWYMFLAPDLTFYAGNRQFRVTGFSASYAPLYDFDHPTMMPVAGMGSADGRTVLRNGEYSVSNGWNLCYNISTGKLLWSYPDNFVGVHGSHNAVPAETGMIRGSYGPCSAITLPAPIGNAWVIPTNVGEWHILTQDGFYLTRLFEPDAMKVKWPEKAIPGASMDSAPCGMGGEDFGGSATVADDGNLYLQAGKTAYWNIKVSGLDTVKAITGRKSIIINDADIKVAQTFREASLQVNAGRQHRVIVYATPTFTGNLDQDFKDLEVSKYQKQEGLALRSAASWDEKNLYLAWDVQDNTPWQNSATDPAQMYIGGDTVDFQLGTDAHADKTRGEAVKGDLRLSIGNFQGRPTAVLYRKVSTMKKLKHFSSGVVHDYVMDYVDVLGEAVINVVALPGQGYVVEAAIPLSVLDFTPVDGETLPGDFGVTHGDTGGRTRLRSYWSNQHTGIVDDAVFELMMEPKNWGNFTFTR